MAPRNPRLRPVAVRDEHDQRIEDDEPAEVFDMLADAVDRVDGLRATLPPAFRRAFDHVLVEFRNQADALKEVYSAGVRS